MKKRSRFSTVLALSSLFTLGACVSPDTTSVAKASGDASLSAPIPGSPSAPAPAPAPAPTSAPARAYTTDALLFTGSGTWGTEISALEKILDTNKISYKTVGSSELDGMSVDDLAQYGLLIVPGGSGGTIAGSVSAKTHANLRQAVQERGLSYIGFCAGSFVAVAPAPAPGKDVSYGFGIVNGPVLDYPNDPTVSGKEYAVVPTTFADGSKRSILWYGGPATPNTAGTVVAKYPSGEAMISEMWSGKGFVVLSAVHPSVSASVLGLSDPDGVDTELTLQLIQAALHQQPLPAN